MTRAMIDGRAPSPARVVLVHDWLVSQRGGEAVLERLASLVAREHTLAAVCTLFDAGVPIGPAVDGADRRASWLGALPGALRLRRWLLPLYPAGVAHLSRVIASLHRRRPIDLVISSSSAAVKGVRAPPGVPHVCYCHCPARYVWSLTSEYAGGLRGVALDAFAPAYRWWDHRTARRVDRFIANSTHIARQIARCYGREATVVFPPVRTDFFTPDPGVRREGFWLVVSALEPYKRVESAVLAAAYAGAELRIVGEGSMRTRLEDLIARTPGARAHLLGRVSMDDLRDLYRRAAVLLYPQIEDFGISAVEAQACGCPVAARALGGAVDTVRDGETGVLFLQPTPAGIAEAAQRAARLAGPACRDNALRFAPERFDAAMRRIIDAALEHPD